MKIAAQKTRTLAWALILVGIAWFVFLLWGAIGQFQEASQLDDQAAASNGQGWSQTLGYQYTGPSPVESGVAPGVRNQGWICLGVGLVGLALCAVPGTTMLRSSSRASERPSPAAAKAVNPVGVSTAPNVPSAPRDNDTAARLRQLTELREAGLVNDEEFASKKAALIQEL